jgi:hypothetical protein
MQLRIAFIVSVFGLLSGCAGSSAPADGAPASTAPASTAAPPATTAAEAPKPAASDPSLCALGKSDTWSSCIGKRVEVRGKEPQMVYQHPMIAPMALPGTAPVMQQSYLETAEGSQIIILSKDADKCAGAKRVTGSLREINLGGPSGTKQSYRGWAIEDAKITCE